MNEAAAAAAAADGRSHKRWATAWKRRPRLCGRCCQRKRLKTGACTQAKVARADDDVRKRRRWRACCGAFAKRKLASSSTDGSGSIGALGIAPPAVPPAETFFARLKRLLCCCCCCCCNVSKTGVRRVCCRHCSGVDDRPDAPKKSAPFKCSGCCVVSRYTRRRSTFFDFDTVQEWIKLTKKLYKTRCVNGYQMFVYYILNLVVLLNYDFVRFVHMDS